MTRRGIIIVLSGAKGAYTSALSAVVAEVLGWKRARFSDFIRQEATSRGENPDDTTVLQKLGQLLVRDRLTEFVRSVLTMGERCPGENLVLDGLRHAEVFRELQTQVASSCDLRVVHVAIDDVAERADRVKRSEGVTDTQFATYDKDSTEAEVEDTPAFANLRVNGAEPRGHLTKTIIRRFVPGFAPSALHDSNESIFSLEPLVVGSALTTLARELINEATAFAGEVPVGLAQPLADLVRAMNCYYSNLIEGHNAPLTDIDLALNGDYERDPEKRHLQAEAKAHIAVQRWIDEGGLEDNFAVNAASLLEVHDRFFSEFPEPQRVQDADGKRSILVVPGNYRRDSVKVANHEPPSPGAIPRLMGRFEEVYVKIESPEEAILSVAPAHHRLLWIHPFADGNGRVARLMSDAMLSRTLHTHSIWSASRGLALHKKEYKHLLSACDQPRRGDRDGRGNLSEEMLTEFTAFFLKTCLEQVRFMRKVLRLDELSTHIDRWVETSAAFGDSDASEGRHVPRLHPSAGRVLKAVLDKGALTPAECKSILGQDVDAAEIVTQLEHHGVLRHRGGAITFVLTAHRAERFLPGLFPG